MNPLPTSSLPHPVALVTVLAGIALLMAAVAALGRWLAATHPDPTGPADGCPTPDVLNVIAAAVAATVGRNGRIVSVQALKAPADPAAQVLMQPWSVEGRRQIYSSHQIR